MTDQPLYLGFDLSTQQLKGMILTRILYYGHILIDSSYRRSVGPPGGLGS